jgi:tetratricopeptide (TPR) repeat protein
MPSHIFMRLGLWEEAIRSNLASKAVAENPATHAGAENRLHAMEFLEYAFLQVGLFDEAKAVMIEAQSVRRADVDPRYPTYFGSAQSRLPALYAIETREWAMAAALQPAEGADWSGQSQTLLANAVAAGHLRDVQLAETAEQAVAAYAKTLPYLMPGGARASVADEIRAWARFAQGDLPGAATLLRPVAERQAQVGKRELELPAREMLAEMLLIGGKPGEALTEYQSSLRGDPNRLNALLGAGQAAELIGNRKLAVGYYKNAIGGCSCATGQAINALAHARAYIRG